MVVKDDGETERVFTAEKVASVKKDRLDRSCPCGGAPSCVAMPSGGTGVHISENKKEDTAQEKTEQKYEKKDYAEYLEHKLEQVLGQMEGVGKVSVMVTVADQGEDIIEKDKTEHTSTVTNTDSGSMEMTTEKESGEETVYEESGGEKAPYVSKEILPEIEGVLGGRRGRQPADRF